VWGGLFGLIGYVFMKLALQGQFREQHLHQLQHRLGRHGGDEPAKFCPMNAFGRIL